MLCELIADAIRLIGIALCLVVLKALLDFNRIAGGRRPRGWNRRRSS